MTDITKQLNHRLHDVALKFKALKNSGIDEEILEIYLMHKTKLSKKKIKEFLYHTKEFYEKLMKDKFMKDL